MIDWSSERLFSFSVIIDFTQSFRASSQQHILFMEAASITKAHNNNKKNQSEIMQMAVKNSKLPQLLFVSFMIEFD